MKTDPKTIAIVSSINNTPLIDFVSHEYIKDFLLNKFDLNVKTYDFVYFKDLFRDSLLFSSGDMWKR
jgi:hypothetical protein